MMLFKRLTIFAAAVFCLSGMAQASEVLVGAGDIANCASPGDEATAALLDTIPGTVFTVGDNAYQSGLLSEFNECYDPSWGRHKARTKPAIGNHEYLTPEAGGYWAYFGAAAGPVGKGYYAYDLGSWRIYVLNSMCQVPSVGGCGPRSAMLQWLKADLAAHPTKCALAYFHHPLFSSGKRGGFVHMTSTWNRLYAAGVDVVVSGHAHQYERFAPQTPSGVPDPVKGIRQFVAGTGGNTTGPFGTVVRNSEVRKTNIHGVLKFTLNDDGYQWRFVPVAGRTFTESGADTCH